MQNISARFTTGVHINAHPNVDELQSITIALYIAKAPP